MKIETKNITRILSLLTCLTLSLFSQAQFVISPGSSINITQGGSLYIPTDFYIESNSSSSGYLADQNSQGECTITGSVYVERYLTANGWHNTSAPLNNISNSVYSGADLIFYYDETIIENDWNFGWVMHQGSLNVMQGYDVYLPSALTAVYSGAGTNLNTGPYSINVYKTDPANGEIESHKGWNLVGNPYPSPVDWQADAGWTKTGINNAKYIWNPANNNYTIFLGGDDPVGLNGGTQYIPSNQGFWVQAYTEGSLSVNNTARITQMQSTPDYYKDNKISYPFIRLSAYGNEFIDECVIRFLDYATEKFDLHTDASKLFVVHGETPQISVQGTKNNYAVYSLNKISNGLQTDINFKCSKSGWYDIEFNEITNISDTMRLYLKDYKEQNIVEIVEKASYNFYHDPSFAENRFCLLFNPSKQQLGQMQKASMLIYFLEGKVKIENYHPYPVEGSINIYSTDGRLLFGKKITIHKKEMINTKLNPGFYIISFISGNYRIDTKLIL